MNASSCYIDIHTIFNELFNRKCSLVIFIFLICIIADTGAFIGGGGGSGTHKKVIIHVPVVHHTIYKIINKEPQKHKHGGDVVHHHHHGGHVAHIHKHEGEASHKHHHHGVADHAHKHVLGGMHKHIHHGKGEHIHGHGGHIYNDHHHKGLHGHEHKHIGAISTSHLHSTTGVHSGHLGHMTDPYELNNALPSPYIRSPLLESGNPWLKYQPSAAAIPPTPFIAPPAATGPQSFQGENAYNPYLPYNVPQDQQEYHHGKTTGSSAAAALYYQKQRPQSAAVYYNPLTGYAAHLRHPIQNPKQTTGLGAGAVNVDYDEQVKQQGQVRQKYVKKLKYGQITPQLAAQLDSTLHSMHVLDEMAESGEASNAPYSGATAEESNESVMTGEDDVDDASQELNDPYYAGGLPVGAGYIPQSKSAQVMPLVPPPMRRKQHAAKLSKITNNHYPMTANGGYEVTESTI